MIDIIIPIKNEKDSLHALCGRIHDACAAAKLDYAMIFVDDRSTDNSLALLRDLQSRYSLKIVSKIGKPGKGLSLLEGLSHATSPYICMIDGDLQYPPEAIGAMVEMMQKDTTIGVVVADRQGTHVTAARRLVSHVARKWVAQLFLSIDCDVQSGLKVFRHDVAKHIDHTRVGKWTFDIQLITTARTLGYRIGSHDIAFVDRSHGSSHVSLFATAWEVLRHMVAARLHGAVIRIPAHTAADHRGAGVALRGQRYITHSVLDTHLSALTTFVTWQKVFGIGILLLILYGAFTSLLTTAIIIMAILTTMYFADFWLNLVYIVKSLQAPPEMSFEQDVMDGLDDKSLPTYTVLCPLYKEAQVIPQFSQAMDRLHWPKSKLEVLFLLEEDDVATIEAMKKMHLPAHFKMIVVPHSFPKTKPKACNYGLQIATGEYVVIYDAEDIPDPYQLKKAYLAFVQSSKQVVCMQAKLNFYNANYNLMTRLFAAEYSLWFDVVLPGMQSLKTNIPLGGTSNHFRTVALRKLHGWDAFNVAEDCDLGARLFRHGYRTAIIDSVTGEEATSKVGNWVRQRSRWIKGYMQTYLVHMRHPFAFMREHGIHALLFQLTVGGKSITMLINPILWVVTISYFTLYAYVSTAIESIFPSVIFYMATSALVFGNFMAMYYYMIGVAGMR